MVLIEITFQLTIIADRFHLLIGLLKTRSRINKNVSFEQLLPCNKDE